MILLTIYSLYHMVYHRTSIYHTDGTITQWFYSPYTLYTIWYTIKHASTIQMYHVQLIYSPYIYIDNHTICRISIYHTECTIYILTIYIHHVVYHRTSIYHTQVPYEIYSPRIYTIWYTIEKASTIQIYHICNLPPYIYTIWYTIEQSYTIELYHRYTIYHTPYHISTLYDIP